MGDNKRDNERLRDPFEVEFSNVINRMSGENHSNTPAHVLGEFLTSVFHTANKLIRDREDWYGVHCEPGNVIDDTKRKDKTDAKSATELKAKARPKLYLSLPITGREAEERREYASDMIAFINKYLPEFEVVNPLDNKLEYDVHWSKHMKVDIAMLIECDAIYMCRDWQWSHGCKLEHDIATSCGLDVYYHETMWQAPIKK